MNRLRWQLRIAANKLGREGIIGLGLMFLSLVAYFALLSPTQTQLQQMEQALNVADKAKRTHSDKNLPSSESLTARLSAYYQYFPPQSSAPDWLGKIYAAAKKNNLRLLEGKYAAVHERAGKLVRYEINLPVTGNFQQIHKFIGKVLNDVPYAALDGITYERHKIGDTSVNAKIRISLYLGPSA